jgi:HemY protein
MTFAYLQAGREAEGRHDLITAEKSYRDGLAIERNDVELQQKLGVLCLAQSRFADAIEPLEAYHRLKSNDAQGALFLGRAYAALGRYDAARQILTVGEQLAGQTGNGTTAQHCREILQRLP